MHFAGYMEKALCYTYCFNVRKKISDSCLMILNGWEVYLALYHQRE